MDWLSNNTIKINHENKYKLPYLYIVDEQAIFIQQENLPEKNKDYLRFILISDTHDKHELLNLPKGDVLIHCGDIVLSGRKNTDEQNILKYNNFNNWLGNIKCDNKLVIGGNHDYYLEKIGLTESKKLLNNCNYYTCEYLELEGFKILLSSFSYGDSKNRAFQSDDSGNIFFDKLKNIKKLDFLITHGPMDKNIFLKRKIQWEIWGHLHGYYGYKPSQTKQLKPNRICTCSMNLDYKIGNGPIILDIKKK